MNENHPMTAAEARVRALRDEVSAVADRLEFESTVEIAGIVDRLRGAVSAVEDDDLGPDASMIRAQFDAMFERLGPLAEAHPGPVSTGSLGLPADARFLRDMADFLTRRYGLEEEG
jgi:hypothetical protein